MSVILLAAFAASPALADSAQSDLARGESLFAQAERQVRVAEGMDEALSRLRALQRAKPRFTWARQRALKGLARDDVKDLETLNALAALEKRAAGELVKVLNAETAHYLAGDARDLARKRNAEALEIAPEDRLALELKEAIAEPPPPPPVVKREAAERRERPRESGDEYWLRRRPPWVRLTPYERRLLARRGLLPGFRPAPPVVQPPASAPSVPRIQPAPHAGGLPQAHLGPALR